MNFYDYTLTLSTGETFEFVEIDPLRIREMSFPGFLEAVSGVLKHCTSVTRDAVENAKRGHSKDLERALRTPAVGCLLKMDRPVCGEINSCINADKYKCTTRLLDKKRRKGNFPECWGYDLPENPEAKMFCTTIVNAWRDSKYVLLIT